jgi:hypothetical protein
MYLDPKKQAERSRKTFLKTTSLSLLASTIIATVLHFSAHILGWDWNPWITYIIGIGIFSAFYKKYSLRILLVDQDEVVLGLNPWSVKSLTNGDGLTGTDPEEYTHGDHHIPPQMRDMEVISLKKDVTITSIVDISKIVGDNSVKWSWLIQYKPHSKRLAWYKLLAEDPKDRDKIIEKILKTKVDNIIELFCANAKKNNAPITSEDLWDEAVRNELFKKIIHAINEPRGDKPSMCDDMGIMVVQFLLHDVKRSGEKSKALQAVGVMKDYAYAAKEATDEILEDVEQSEMLTAMMAIGGQYTHSIGIMVGASDEAKAGITDLAKTYAASKGLINQAQKTKEP